jgi:guanosine-3',5'-bis(diphosphate) 3'-pyrophosphohydrolase
MTENQNDLALIFKALEFASIKHRDQRRKDADASPYINHPISLAKVLCVEGGVTDVNVICAAINHDTIEDTETTFEELTVNFGEAIAKIVQEVTDDKTLKPEVRKRLQIEHAPHASYEAKLVKLADKICNLRDIVSTPPADWSLQRKQEYFDWAKKVVDQIRSASVKLSLAFDEAYAQKPMD